MPTVISTSIHLMSKIFELLFRYRLELSPAELASHCGVSEAYIAPILMQLVDNGWARYDHKSNLYRYGLKLLPFTSDTCLTRELIRQCTPVMELVAKECNQTVVLNVLEGKNAVCIQKIESKNTIHIAAKIGKEGPLHAGCSGRIILAYAPESVREEILGAPLTKYTPFTITSPEVLNNSLFEIRRTGYSCSVEELDPGAAGVSCAILDESNNLLAGLSVIGTRFAYEKDASLWKAMLIKAVEQIHLV